MLSSSRYWLWITYTESSPTPPHTSAIACTALRLVAAATCGSTSATMKQVME